MIWIQKWIQEVLLKITKYCKMTLDLNKLLVLILTHWSNVFSYLGYEWLSTQSEIFRFLRVCMNLIKCYLSEESIERSWDSVHFTAMILFKGTSEDSVLGHVTFNTFSLMTFSIFFIEVFNNTGTILSNVGNNARCC